jgi:hypothetical protein
VDRFETTCGQDETSLDSPTVDHFGEVWEAQGQERRPVPADGTYKKVASLGSAEEKRRHIHHHRQELGLISKAK